MSKKVVVKGISFQPNAIEYLDTLAEKYDMTRSAVVNELVIRQYIRECDENEKK